MKETEYFLAGALRSPLHVLLLRNVLQRVVAAAAASGQDPIG
jgi:hypothetical protein